MCKLYNVQLFSEFQESEILIRNRLLDAFLMSNGIETMAYWETKTHGFPSVKEAAIEDIQIKRYGRLEIPYNL